MQFSASQIAQIINGKVEGDANIAVASFGKIEEANNGQLTFLPMLSMKIFYTVPMHLLLSSAKHTN